MKLLICTNLFLETSHLAALIFNGYILSGREVPGNAMWLHSQWAFSGANAARNLKKRFIYYRAFPYTMGNFFKSPCVQYVQELCVLIRG